MLIVFFKMILKYSVELPISLLFHAIFVYDLCTISRAIIYRSQGFMSSKVYKCFRYLFLMPIPLVRSFLWWGGSSHGLGVHVPTRPALHIPSSVRGLV